MALLSEWLQIMLAEISRKREEALHSAEEQQRRASAPAAAAPSTPTPPAPTPTTTASTPKRSAAA